MCLPVGGSLLWSSLTGRQRPAWAPPALSKAKPIRKAPLAVTIANRPVLDVEIRMMDVPPCRCCIAWVIADRASATGPAHAWCAPQHSEPGLLVHDRAGGPPSV